MIAARKPRADARATRRAASAVLDSAACPAPVRDFPLFPLGIVALPTESVPLHIFEDRYRKMIEHCLAEGVEFGILWLSDEELKQIGCACEIEQRARADGGRPPEHPHARNAPVQLLERQDDLPYPAGEVEFTRGRARGARRGRRRRPPASSTRSS